MADALIILHPAVDHQAMAALAVYEYLADQAEALHRKWGDRVGRLANVQLRILSIMWTRLNMHLVSNRLEALPRWMAAAERFTAVTNLIDPTAGRQPVEQEIRAEVAKLAMNFVNAPQAQDYLMLAAA